MADVGFYHLTRTGAGAALPALLGRTLAAGERAVVRAANEAGLAAVDAALWACAEWLPHGTEDAALQPIWLTLGDAAGNGGRFLFLVDGAGGMLERFQRVFDLFDGNDADAVAAARGRWVAAKAAGHVLTYWRQGERGWSKD